MKHNSSVISLNDFSTLNDRPVNTIFGAKIKIYLLYPAVIVIYSVL